MDFPDWYEGGWADSEALVRDMLMPWVGLVDPKPDVVAWLPDKYSEKLPLISVARENGASDLELLDDGNVTIACICKSRHESWQLFEYVRMLMRSYRKGGLVTRADGSKTRVVGVRELVGPELMQLSDFDSRIVPATFLVETRIPASLPDYERIRTDLNL